MSRPVYTFASPFSREETVNLIYRTIEPLGKIKKQNTHRGYIKLKYKKHLGFLMNQRFAFEFFVSNSKNNTRVRMCMNDDLYGDSAYRWKPRDRAWDDFLRNLFNLSPNTDFGVSLAEDDPYVIGVLYLGSDTQQVYTSHSYNNASMTGFLLGGALFGTAGAIVGGMNGSQYTYGKTREEFADKQLARVLYNNGRIWEGVLKKGSPLYNEVMVNME